MADELKKKFQEMQEAKHGRKSEIQVNSFFIVIMLKTELLILIICREDVVLHHVWPRVLRHVYVRHVHDPHGGHSAGQPVAPEESVPHVQEAGRGDPPYLPVNKYLLILIYLMLSKQR